MAEQLRSEIDSVIEELKIQLDSTKDVDWTEVYERLEELESETYTSLRSRLKDKQVTRREMLKLLGLGAGGTALVSSGAAWSVVRPASKGTSDIDVDTVGSEEATTLGKDVKRDSTGRVQFTQTGTATKQVSSTGAIQSFTLQGSGLVLFDKLAATISGGYGDLTIKRNGTRISSGSNSLNYTNQSGSPGMKSPKWTVSASVSGNWEKGGTLSGYSGGNSYFSQRYPSYTAMNTRTLSSTGEVIYGYMKFTGPTAYIKVSDSTTTKTIATGYSSTTSVLKGTIAGSFASPKIKFMLHPTSDKQTGSWVTSIARLYSGTSTGTATVKFTANKNQFTKVYK